MASSLYILKMTVSCGLTGVNCRTVLLEGGEHTPEEGNVQWFTA